MDLCIFWQDPQKATWCHSLKNKAMLLWVVSSCSAPKVVLHKLHVYLDSGTGMCKKEENARSNSSD